MKAKSFPQYAGLGYTTASREAARLIERAHATGSWFDLPEKLEALRGVMQGQMARAVQGTSDAVARASGHDITA